MSDVLTDGLLACGYAYVAVSDDDRFRSLLVAFLVTTIVLNVLVTVLLGEHIGLKGYFFSPYDI